ncbi:D-Ala-D-Ala carboxypeptidase family metallohydrolase [Stenotrophomonas maltophilia]|uniref:RHS repeat-associated core domain-containing protein n=1 Tax=Stenotrophomonas maltophilia TaxID=40324 RepID=UPI001F53BDC3|nr:D-Ala-D-Ala carboxypeptidase family metallohydrolase [Stenotrophomonas maltophilia]
MAYDAQGQRLRAMYSLAGQLVHEERRGKGASEYIHAGGRLLATRSPTGVTWTHVDALGSPVAVTDNTGSVVERRRFEPYGAELGGQVKDGPGYTGHVSDSATGTGLVHMQQRYMDPQLGVFLSVDPVTAYEQPAGQFNRYRYANGNPYKFTDPDGRQAVPGQPLVFYQTTTRTTTGSGAVDVVRTSVSNYGIVHGTRTEVRGTVTFLPQKSLGGAPANPGSEVTTKLLNFSDKSGKNVEVASGQRTVDQNRTVGGASRSQHLQDNAADIRINGSTAKQTADAAHSSGEFNRVNQYTDGLGVHVDLKQDGTQGRFTDWKPKE